MTTIILSALYFSFFFFYCYGAHRDLHSFPTRRSSDLAQHPLRRAFADRLHVAAFLQQLAAHVQRRERSEEHTSELQSRFDLVCRLLLEKKKTKNTLTDPSQGRVLYDARHFLPVAAIVS